VDLRFEFDGSRPDTVCVTVGRITTSTERDVTDARSLESSAGSLDEIRVRALAGDPRAETELFARLRVRFLSLAKRRVQPDHAEDVVQEALGVVLRKYRHLDPDRGILIWSLTVLRNVIGNHYQARRRDTEQTTRVEDWHAVPEASLADDPAESLLAEETARRLEAAIAELARTSPRCGLIFGKLLASLETGGGPREVSSRALAMVQQEQPDLARNSFYVALHRCRAQLRTLLARTDGETAHA
jgi:RNA polymerase sigma factor (sigma-70 family)